MLILANEELTSSMQSGHVSGRSRKWSIKSMYAHKVSARKIQIHHSRLLIGRPGPLEAFLGIGNACLGIAHVAV